MNTRMNTKTLEWLLAREHHRGWSERDEEVAALKREKAELQLELARVTEELVVSRMDSSELSANMLEKTSSLDRVDASCSSLWWGASCKKLAGHNGPCVF